ncbi:MAG: cytochrome C assembly protein [Planctomycetes bacterium]|nr:cytochrome C assembly protein [Planctomycetota bacterium]
MNLSGVTITCFAASYALALVLEGTRLLGRLPARHPLMLLIGAAGLFAHSVYLVNLAYREASAREGVFASWYDWSLLTAWILAAAYLALAARRPANSVGIFLLPLVLVAIGLAMATRRLPPFAASRALGSWRIVHGGALLVGTVAVILGFATGLMYLLHSYRLKHKLPPRPGLRLPSLEWLQRFNRETLWISTGLLAVGLTAGIVMNVSPTGPDVLWTDSVVLSSGALFLWLVAVTLFEAVYHPSRQGRKVAYLTLAHFLFLALALVLVVLGGHASRPRGGTAAAPRAARADVEPRLETARPSDRAARSATGRGGRS